MDCSDSITDYTCSGSERSDSLEPEMDVEMEIERERENRKMLEAEFERHVDKSMNKQTLIGDVIPKVMLYLLEHSRLNDLRPDISYSQREQLTKSLLHKLRSGNAELRKQAQDEIQAISSWHDVEFVTQGGQKVQERTKEGELKFTKDGEPVYKKVVKLSNALRETPEDLRSGDRKVLHLRVKNKPGIAGLLPFLKEVMGEHQIIPETFTALPAFNSMNGSKNKKNTYKGVLLYLKYSRSDLKRIERIQREGYFAGKPWKDLVQGLVQAQGESPKGYVPIVKSEA